MISDGVPKGVAALNIGNYIRKNKLLEDRVAELEKTQKYLIIAKDNAIDHAVGYRSMLQEVDRLLEGLSSGREMGTDASTASEKGKRYASQIQMEIRAALKARPELTGPND